MADANAIIKRLIVAGYCGNPKEVL